MHGPFEVHLVHCGIKLAMGAAEERWNTRARQQAHTNRGMHEQAGNRAVLGAAWVGLVRQRCHGLLPLSALPLPPSQGCWVIRSRWSWSVLQPSAHSFAAALVPFCPLSALPKTLVPLEMLVGSAGMDSGGRVQGPQRAAGGVMATVASVRPALTRSHFKGVAETADTVSAFPHFLQRQD